LTAYVATVVVSLIWTLTAILLPSLRETFGGWHPSGKIALCFFIPNAGLHYACSVFNLFEIDGGFKYIIIYNFRNHLID
jgi:hypothetical protein